MGTNSVRGGSKNSSSSSTTRSSSVSVCLVGGIPGGFAGEHILSSCSRGKGNILTR